MKLSRISNLLRLILTAALVTPLSAHANTGDVVVTTPLYGATVGSSFPLIASDALCSGQAVSAMGYSFDSGSTTIINGSSINTKVTAPLGAHTLHVKSWGRKGSACGTGVAITISPNAASVIPANAIAVNAIQNLPNWAEKHDPGAGTSSSGSMTVTSSPSLSGYARRFYTTYSGYGGELYHISWGKDTAATNFFYDAWVYFKGSTANVANLEMDMNQVMANGQTVIYGFQCNGWSHTWDYTKNAGTPAQPNDKWLHSNQVCDVKTWKVNAWHHVQVWYSRDASGNVTYHSVWLNGTEQPLNVTVPSAFALGWGTTLLTNFQIDGATSTSGSSTVLLDNLTIYRW